MYRLVFSRLRNLWSAVDQYSSSQPASLAFDPTSVCNLNRFFYSRAPVATVCEKMYSGRHTQEGRRGMCSDTLNPGWEVRGCSVGWMLGTSDVSPFVFIAATTGYMGFLELNKIIFQAGVFWVRRNFLVTKYSAPYDASLNVMQHTGSRRSVLSAVRSSSSKRRLARSNTRRVL